MLSAVAGALVPGQAEDFKRASRAFHAAVGGDGDPRVAAEALSQRAGQLSNSLSRRVYRNADAFQIVAVIGDNATRPLFTDYAGSVQAVMAVDALLNGLVENGEVTSGAAAGIRANLNQAYAAVKEPNSYRPSDFRASLATAVAAIARLQ